MRDRANELRNSVVDDRGVSPTVGFVLLVGIVFVGVAIGTTAGLSAIDSFAAQNEAEVALAAAESTEHGITTAARTGQTQSVSIEDGSVRATGNVSIAWYAESMDAGNETVENRTLGAIEYQASDRTIVYQSGGVWEVSDGRYRTRSTPSIGDDDGGLSVRLVALTVSGSGSGGSTVRPNPDGTFGDDLREITDSARDEGYDNLSIVIESDHHEGWKRHLESEFSPDGDDNLSVESGVSDPTVGNGGENTVEFVVENVSETRSGVRINGIDVRVDR